MFRWVRPVPPPVIPSFPHPSCGYLAVSMAMSELISSAETVFKPPALDADTYRKALQDSSWADVCCLPEHAPRIFQACKTDRVTQGLRGIAAVFVMCSHLTLCFARYIVSPNYGQDQGSAWMQRPIFRLVGQGPAWVACFFILSGFVNALKPIKLARGGSTETALPNLAVSSFRRSFRLFLPATTATLISWFITQLGAHETARQSNAYWMYSTSPAPSASWPDAVGDLARAIQSTWSYFPNNPYDQPQWALLYLLQGSMFVFTALLTTINLTPNFRMAALALLYVWSTNWGMRLADRMLHILCTWTATNMFLSYVWDERLCGCYARRTQPLRLSFPPFSLLSFTGTASRPNQSRPHVLPRRLPRPGALVALPFKPSLQNRPRKCRRFPLLAGHWRPAPCTHNHLFAGFASGVKSQVATLARQDQLSIIPSPRNVYSHSACVAIVGESTTHANQRR